MNQSQKEFRKRRGREIAERFRIEPDSDGFRVPSETRAKKTYHVVFTPTDVSCTCLDHAATREWCKHIYAVEFDLQRKGGLDLGEPPVGPRRPTYPRDHAANTEAQTREEDECALMLFALAQGITEPPRKRGRRPVSRRDAAFALNGKVYHGKSARRTVAWLNHAVREGYLSRPVSQYAIHDYMENPEMGPILEDILVRSSLPLARIETCFAADSTGMSSSRFVPWRDIKYRGMTERNWAKVHVMVGVKTLIVTAAVIEDRDASDLAQLPRLLETTARNFTIKEVYADKVYNTKHNQEVIASYGARGYIPFKDNHTGKGGGIWTEQFLRWLNDRVDFDQHYHQRSKIEAAFMSMKTNFGDSLRSRSEIAMRNEVLCKLICHNLVCLNRAMDKYNIGFAFLSAALEAAE